MNVVVHLRLLMSSLVDRCSLNAVLAPTDRSAMSPVASDSGGPGDERRGRDEPVDAAAAGSERILCRRELE